MANCWFCYKSAGDKQYHTRCCETFFGRKEAPELIFNKRLLNQLAEQTINQRIAVTGVQPKLSVAFEKPNRGNQDAFLDEDSKNKYKLIWHQKQRIFDR